MPSFFISEIVLAGADHGSFPGWKRITHYYEHRCLTQKDIILLVNALQNELMRKGFITAKVIVPEQNIMSGVLKLQYIPGRIRRFAYTEYSQQVWERGTFPTSPGAELNLRDIEQGIENIRRAPGQQIQMKIVPTGVNNEIDIWLSVKEGHIEIAGARAGLILANPNGITIEGTTVYNADRVTFHAGTIDINTSWPRLSTAKGDIKIKDLDACLVGQTNLIGDTINITGKVKADKINFLAGRGEIDYRTMSVTPHREENSSQIYISTTAESRVQAHVIHIQAIGNQVGLIHQGFIDASQTLRFHLTGDMAVNGYLTGSILSEIQTTQDLQNKGIINGNRLIILGQNIMNEGSLLGGDIRIQATHLENKAGSKVKNPQMEEWDKKIDDLEKEIEGLTEEIDSKAPDNVEDQYDLEYLEKEYSEAEEKLKQLKEERGLFPQYIYEDKAGGIIYGAHHVSVQSDYLYNQERAIIAGENHVYLRGQAIGTDGTQAKAHLIHNHGGDIRSNGGISIYTHELKNTNANLQLCTREGHWEEEPDRIEIDAEGSEYNHVIDARNKFKELEHRLRYFYTPYPKEIGKWQIYHPALLETVYQEPDAGEDDEAFEAWESAKDTLQNLLKQLDIDTNWRNVEQTELDHIIQARIKEKYGKATGEYNEMVTQYNQVLTFKNYWAIYSKNKQISTNLVSSMPGQIISANDLYIVGKTENKDSAIIVGGRLSLQGGIYNNASVVEKSVQHSGRIEHWVSHEYWRWGNHTRREKISTESYEEPEEKIPYYIPAVSYQRMTKDRTSLALTGREGIADGIYTITEEVERDKKQKDLIISLDTKSAIEKTYASSLISAKEIITTEGEESVNEGTMLSHTMVWEAKNICNRGSLQTKDGVWKASEDFINTGNINSEKRLWIDGKRVQFKRGDIWAREEDRSGKSVESGVHVTGDNSLLYLQAKDDLSIENFRLVNEGQNGKIGISSDHHLSLDIVTDSYQIGTPEGSSTEHRKVIEKDSGSIVEGNGDITLQATNDLRIKSGVVRSAKGHVRILAGKDVEITTGKNVADGRYYWWHNNRHGTTTVSEKHYEKNPISSEILGETVSIVAGRDVNLLSSNTINRGNTRIKAGRDITSDVDTALTKDEYTKTCKGNGIQFGGGFFGIRIGQWMTTHKEENTTERPVPTTITSTNGRIDLDAEGKIHATTTYIYGKDGVTLQGASITLDGAYNKETYRQTDAYSFKGIGIGLGGSTISKVQNAYVFGSAALSAQDKRLALLEGLEAGSELGLGHRKNYKQFWDIEGKDGLTLTVALLDDQSKASYENIIIRHQGGKIKSEGDIIIRAKDLKNGTVKIIGETLTGKKIKIEGHHIDISSANNKEETSTTSESSEKEIGADVGKSGAFMPHIGYQEGNQKSEETKAWYTPALINGDRVQIHAGGNMNIQGSLIAGKQVDITVSGNLSVRSDKTSYTYRQKNGMIGVGVTLEMKQGSANKGCVDYRLETVREQAGIFVGKEGLRIQIGGKTTITGALIDSLAPKDKNHIITKELELQKLTNRESVLSKGGGIGWNDGRNIPNEKGLIPYIPIAGRGNQTSYTYAAIVDGKLQVTGDKNFKTDEIDRNTQDVLNALESTLDLQAISEKKRLSELFGKHANEAVHKLSEKNDWANGSPEKVLLHAVVGGLTAKIGGDSYSAGTWSGAVNEVMNGEIAKYEAEHGKINADLHQWLSAIVGTIVARATGQTLQTGAAEAVYGTRWNDLAFQKERLTFVYKRPWVSEDGKKTVAGHLYISDGVNTLGVTPDYGDNFNNYVEEKVNGEYVKQLIATGDAIVVATVNVENTEKAINFVNDALHQNTTPGGIGRYNFNIPRKYMMGGTCIDYGADIIKMLKEEGVPVEEKVPLNLLLPFESMGHKVAHSIVEWKKDMDSFWSRLVKEEGDHASN